MFWTKLGRKLPGAVEIGSGEEVSSVSISVDVSNLPKDAVHLIARDSVLSTSGAIDVALRLNSDVAANYFRREAIGAVSSATSAPDSAATSYEVHRAGAVAFEFTGGDALIVDAFSTRSFKSILSIGGNVEDEVRVDAGNWAKSGKPVIVTVTWLAIGGGLFAEGSIFSLAAVDEMYLIPGSETIVV